jgi:hypothetical protein
MTTAEEMVIMWPNHDGSVTLSQRIATGHTEPQVLQNPPRPATQYLQLSSVSSGHLLLLYVQY